MGKTYTLQLAASELGQILDGLRSRSEAWHGTAEFLTSGTMPCDDFVIEECSDADEARAIAADYDLVIKVIEAQRNAQHPSC